METRERDLERLIPMHKSGASPRAVVLSVPPSPHASPIHVAGREAIYKVIRSWASKKFMTGCVILLPMAVTFYFTWWFIHFVDGFFSPIYTHLGINMFGLGFMTSITFIFLVGVFMSSWLGASVLSVGEWFIKKMPLVSYIYSASKQISGAISPGKSLTKNVTARPVLWTHHKLCGASTPVPRIVVVGLGFEEHQAHQQTIYWWMPVDERLVSMLCRTCDGSHGTDHSSGAFKEVAIIRHPHMGEYAFGFITSTVVLRGRAGGEELCCVYVPTNHLYLGDIFLISSKDIIRPNLSVREGIEIVMSAGMSIPQILTTQDSETIHRTVLGSFAIPPV